MKLISTRKKLPVYVATGLLVVLSILCLRITVAAQSASLGNTYIPGGGEVAVFGAHSFQNGGSGVLPGLIVTDRTSPQGYFSFAPGSSASSAADNAHVDGYVKKYGTTAFTFPIGNGTVYRPLITPAQSSSAIFDAAYFSTNPSSATLPASAPFPTSNVGTGVSAVSQVEYWDLNGTANTTVTLTWNASSALNTLTGGIATWLIIVGYNASTSKWENLGQAALTGTVSTTGTITSTVSFAPNTYSALTFGYSSQVVANPDAGTVSTGIGGTAVANVAANDVVNSVPVTLGGGGNATVASVGTYPLGITFNPATGSMSVAQGTTPGSYTVAYQLCDKLTPVTCTTALVTITIKPLPPVATSDIANTTPATPVSGNVLINDTEPQGLPLTATLLSQPLAGTVTLASNGSYTYTPPANFTGTTSFCYSISSSTGLSSSACVTVNVVPDPTLGNNRPVANDDNTQTIQNRPVIVAVLANDTDPDSATGLNGQLANPTIVAQPSAGTAVVNANGTVTYTPPTGFTGVVSFPYQVCDKASPALCTTATVSVNVQLTPPVGTTLTPVAIDDALLTQINTPKSGDVSLNDTDPQSLSLSYTTGQPNSGTVVMSSSGSYTYTPATGFTGPASFTYVVCNMAGKCSVATVSVLVQPLPLLISLLPQVYLQGALFGVTASSLMRDDLRAGGYLPLSHPYAAWTPITPVGPMAASVTAVTGVNAIVDWVFVELRSAANGSTVVDSRAALLQRDGDIVGVDGVSPITFSQALSGSYYVAIRHRNHLGVMSQSALPLSSTTTVVDFRTPATSTFTYTGTSSYTQVTVDQAQVVVQQGVAMWAGNVLEDAELTSPHNFVIYQGTKNDVNAVYQQVINGPANILVSPFYKLKGYYTGDVTLNGETIFQGTSNDVEYIYQNIIKNHPGNSLKASFFKIREQLP